MITEEIRGSRVRHYSDEGYKIRQVEMGKTCESTEDRYPCVYPYEKTDGKIPMREEKLRRREKGRAR